MLHHYISKEAPKLTVNVRPGVDIKFENFTVILNDEIEEDQEKIAHMDGYFLKENGQRLVYKADMAAAEEVAKANIAAKKPQASKGGFSTSLGNANERAAISAEMSNPTVLD